MILNVIEEFKIGDESGCMEITGGFDEVNQDLRKNVVVSADAKWNEFSVWSEWFYDGDFSSYYKLNKTESAQYDARKVMPKSFVNKYRQKSNYYSLLGNDGYENYAYNDGTIANFLFHKKNPNTSSELNKAYKKGLLYKVKCKRCGRVFLMDAISFSCVKWKACLGAECLAVTVNEAVDYSNSLYTWSANENELLVLNHQLANVEELCSPLTYYGLAEELRIAYVSDIHLLHHLKYYNNNASKMIHNIVDSLYESMSRSRVIIFDGDASSNSEVTMAFYSYFMRKHDYKSFVSFKKELLSIKRIKYALSNNKESKYVKRYSRLIKYIESRKQLLSEKFNFSDFERYRNTYYSYSSYEEAFEFYKKVKSFKNMNLSEDVQAEILYIVQKLDVLTQYQTKIEKYEIQRSRDEDQIEDFEDEYRCTIENASLCEYKHSSLSDKLDIYVVLGNHEYIDFSNVNECVGFYREQLTKLGIRLLHNSYYEKGKYLIYGGTGFAKYDDTWNADSIICCKGFSREDEHRETTLFEEGYYAALKYAKIKKLCFLCASHYPISACLNNCFDKEAIYFTGHNHQNCFIKKANKVLYADNQIGYKDNNIMFRIATTGFELNPFADLEDGLYQAAIKDYLQFYRYIGEDVGKGNLLYQRCKDGKANLYVIKRKGYYGFFIMNPEGSSKGISIVNGGVTKKLTCSTDLSWICENFDIVLLKYLKLLAPLRNAQERLSKELKEFGLDGKIHGCIVDINFYHHVMVNPLDGSMTFYYSSVFGMAMNLASFEEVIKSLEIHKGLFDSYDCKQIQQMYEGKSKSGGLLLGKISDGFKIELEKSGLEEISDRDEVIVSRREEMYGISRKINPLQRLFSGHILREFDLRLTETKQEAYRKYLYLNRCFYFEGVPYKIMEDDGSDIVIAEELNEVLEDGKETLVPVGEKKGFAISALKAKIANYNERDTYWIKD